MNNKKFLCLFIALLVCVQALSFSVFADDYSGITGIVQNDVDCLTSVLNVVKDVLSGEKSVQEGYSAIQAISNRVVKQNVKEVLTLPYNSETELNGVTPRDFADKITTNVRKGLRDMGGDITENTITTDNIDTKGAGAVLYMPNVNGREYEIYYMNYGEFYYNGSDLYFSTNGIYKRTLKSYGGDPATFDFFENSIGFASDLYKYYGDWRYRENGAPASDKTSPVQSSMQTIDTSQMSDSDLIELLQDMINKLKIEFPDLSTIEGLLSAIYNRLGTLDSDDDSPLLSTINNSILSLKTSIDNLKIEGTENNFDFSNLFGDLNFKDLIKDNKFVVDIDLSDILSGNKVFSDNALNFYFKVEDDYASTKFTELKDKFDSKFSFIDTLKDRRDFYFDEFKKLWSENNEGV